MPELSCPHCGGQIGALSNRCLSCGALVSAAPGGASGLSPSAPPPRAQQYVPPPPRPLSRAYGVILAVAIGAVVLLFALLALFFFNAAIPAFVGGNTTARETESKAGLHNIQSALERYATDHHRVYPAYLTGGSAYYASSLDAGANAFGAVSQVGNVKKLADPLLREGYLPSYPSNPFVRNGMEVRARQLTSSNMFHLGDPLASPGIGGKGGGEAATYGTRFGADCTLMGGVLGDARYPHWWQRDGRAGQLGDMSSYADVGWFCWDAGGARDNSARGIVMPGEFFYKSAGRLSARDAAQSANHPIAPPGALQYVLGGYGGPVTRGLDVLGEEKPALLSGAPVYPWTRSRTDAGQYGGSPYRLPDKYDGSQKLLAGNPNGIADGVVLVLESEEAHRAP